MGQESPSIDMVVARTKIGRGTIQRIREGEAATRIDSLTKIAEAFGLEVWQLMVPSLDPKALPVISAGNPESAITARLASIEARLDAQAETLGQSRKRAASG